MLATGGSAEAAVARLIEKGAAPKNIYFTGIIAAQEGLALLAQHIPQENITLAAVDEKLDAHKYIVPGLGDFGDRYFGY
jgi:uracil phosphoribosyltransferase